MKIYYSALLVLSVAGYASGFAPPMRTASYQRLSIPAVSLSMVEEATGSDVSIPYDSAARLAYDEWRALFNKGQFDAKRFESFKNNYETITVANVVTKKRAREEGTVSLSLMTLNEFGDLSEEEYKQAMQKGTSTTTTTADVLSKAMEAAELQTQASNALGEAADALAEEEQVRIYTAIETQLYTPKCVLCHSHAVVSTSTYRNSWKDSVCKVSKSLKSLWIRSRELHLMVVNWRPKTLFAKLVFAKHT